MIRTLFDRAKPQFVSLRNGQFVFKEQAFSCLEVFIKDIIPVRKRFAGNKLVCFAPDAANGRHGKICGFCHERSSCQQRLRLHLLITNTGTELVPAVLEIKHHLFGPLEKAIQAAGQDNLADVIIQLTTETGTRTAIHFNPIF